MRMHLSARAAGRVSALVEPSNPSTLSTAIGDSPQWQARGLCRQTDPDMFYAPPSKKAAEAAKRICGRCDVRAECLQWALANDEEYGIWGGTDPQEREAMKPQKKKSTPQERAAEILAAGEKECPRCQVVKRLDSYPLDRNSLTGHGTTCKSCRYDLEIRSRAAKRSGLKLPRAQRTRSVRNAA